MARQKINISPEKSIVVDGINSQPLNKRFGRREDYIELHIYSNSGELLVSEENFFDYKFPKDLQGELSHELNMDPQQILKNYGFTSGKYKLSFNIQRKKNSKFFD